MKLTENGCVKTGCHVFLHEYREWIYGDAFHFNGTLIIRVCARHHDPVMEKVHFNIFRISHWFDQGSTSVEKNSTLVTQNFNWHGYEGEDFKV